MSGWTGWEADILVALGVPNTTESRGFLADWQREEPSSCSDNPLLASRAEPGSTSCKQLSNGKQARSYTSRTQGRQASVAQLRSSSYPHLLAALKLGTPWTPGDAPGIYADLVAWGVSAFAEWYKAQFGGNFGGGGSGGGGGSASHAHKGWDDLRQRVNVTLPTALRRIAATNSAALRSLPRRRSVRR